MSLIEEEKNEQNVAANQAKQFLKNTGKRIVKKLILILLPIIIVLLIISAITWFVFQDEGTWNEKETGNPSTYTKNVKLSATDGISMDKMELIKTALSDMGFTNERIESMDEAEIIDILKMNMKLNKTVTSIEECTIAEILWCVSDEYSKYLKKPEDLEYLLNAEIVTQYPKIDGVSEDKLNGIIEFARVGNDDDTDGDGDVDKDDNPTILTYIDSAEFDTKFNNYISKGNTEVFNYFTIDESENVIIATWNQENGNFESNNTTLQTQKKIKPAHTVASINSEYDERYVVNENTAEKITASYVTYTASKKPINYKANVQKYTLPFEYLWALLVMGESDDFVLNLAKLAYESKITIGIYDSVITSVNINTNNYTENFREWTEEENASGVLINNTQSECIPESYSYTDKNVKTTISNTVQEDILYANTWIVEVISQYKKINSTEPYPEEPILTPDELWTDNGTWTETIKHGGDPITDKETGEITGYTSVWYTYKTHVKQKKTTGQSTQSDMTITYDKYEKVKTEVKEKTDIDPNTDENFVKLLRADQNASTLLFKPINVLWLCDDILAHNADTVNMVELTKYLINKAKNPDDTSLSFDFGMFEPGSFNSYNTGFYGNSVAEKVWFALKGVGFSNESIAGAMGNFAHESGFKTNNLENSHQGYLGYTDETYTNAVNDGSYSIEKFISDHKDYPETCGAGYGLAQWTFYSRKQGLYAYAKHKEVSIDDVDMQIEYLIGELTGQGEAANLGFARYIKANKWKNAQTVKEATKYFLQEVEITSLSSLSDREEQAQKYWDMFHDMDMPNTEAYMDAVVTNDKRVSAVYGNDGYHDHYHRGIDIAAAGGTPIIALGSGTVVQSQYNSARGYFVRIDHGNGYCTLYQHCSSIANGIDIGTKVEKGQVIGYVGNTGQSSGNHLHLEVWVPHGQGYDNWGNLIYDVTDPATFNYSLLPK